MTQIVKLKRSASPGKVPTTNDLELGELAINTFDGKLYFEKDNGAASIVSIATDSDLANKQDTLVSGSNIKTINGESILGSGDITVSGGGGSMTYPEAGITVSTGSAWSTSLAAPAGELVGTTGTQTLSNKTLNAVNFTEGYTEQIYSISGTAPVLTPKNGTIQTWTLSNNSTPSWGTFLDGQSITLAIDDGASYAINWPTTTTEPVLVGSKSQSFGNTASVSFVLDFATQQVDDIMIVAIGSDGSLPVVPSDWNILTQVATSGTVFATIAYKVVSVPGAIDTIAISDMSVASVGIAMLIRGGNTEAIKFAQRYGTSGMPILPSVDVANYSLLLGLGFLDDDSAAASVTAPIGFTLRQSIQSTTTGMTGMFASRIANPGTSPQATFGGTGTDDWASISIAIPGKGLVSQGVAWQTYDGGAPPLNKSTKTFISLWKVDGTIYGARIGDH